MITTNPCIASARKNDTRERKEKKKKKSILLYFLSFTIFFSLHRAFFKTFFTEWNGRLMENDNVSIRAMIDDGEIN